MSHRAAPFLASLLLALTALADGKPGEAAGPTPDLPPDMESYQLVLLKRGPKWTPEVTPALEKLQERHLAHLSRLADEGKIVVAGPFSNQKDLSVRGACIYRVGSVDEARALAEQDPAVKAGRLVVEAVTWWVEKGYMTFPKAPPRAR